MIDIRITPGSSTPIWQQIVTQVRHAITTGIVTPGEMVPSVRALAELLLINPNTVAKAYADLTKDGLLVSQAGKGLAVAPRRPGLGIPKEERIRRLEEFAAQLIREAIALELPLEDVEEQLRNLWKELGSAGGGTDKP